MKRLDPRMALLLILLATIPARAGDPWEVGRPSARKTPAESRLRDFFIRHVVLHLEPDVVAHHLVGRAVLQVESGLPQLQLATLDLSSDLTVTQVTDGSVDLAYSHAGDELEIDLGQPYDPGATFLVEISYQGDDPGPFLFFQHQGVDSFCTSSCPDQTHAWWPCKEITNQKFTCDVHVRVPDWMTVLSQGVQTGDVDHGDGTHTVTWETDHLIAPYLVSVAGSIYQRVDYEYQPQAGGASMPVPVWLYPDLAGSPPQAFADTPDILDFYARTFGEYPFLDEKYGQVSVHMGFSGMEHQTITYLDAGSIPGGGLLSLVAHEAAHMWWGDYITLEDWRHVWLNEGFATYSDALYHEDRYGPENLRSRMAGYANRTYHGTIYDPIQTFGIIVYTKGAWVLHMLRREVGEDDFWTILWDYFHHPYFPPVAATIDIFQDEAEFVSGMDLEQFFQQWIYGPGRPDLEGSWTAYPDRDGWRLELSLSQVQSEPPFQAPLDLEITTVSGSSREEVRLEQRDHVFTFDLTEEPTGLELDPDVWLLKWLELTHEPAATPTPELSPTPAPSPTPGEVWYALEMPDLELQPGEEFLLTRRCGNDTGTTRSVDEYIVLDAAGSYWFWPGWGENLDHRLQELLPGASLDETILEFLWPTGAGSGDGIRFWGALLEPVSLEVIQLTWVEWGYREP